MTSNYETFLASKIHYAASAGLETYSLHARLFPFQRQVTAWAIGRGRAALFLDTGLGKSACQLVWAQNIASHGGDVLILAPLAVAQQTVTEGATMGIQVAYARTQAEAMPGITITNYERLHVFDTRQYAGVVLDESSILKAYDGKTRTALIEAFRHTPYRLCCTATPSPNDHMELGNHAEFLGIMRRSEMLATFFTHDGGHTSQWRLKRHAEAPFWRWVASWAMAITHPLQLGDSTPGYDLPALHRHDHMLALDGAHEGLTLFPMEARSLLEQRHARRAGLSRRIAHAVEIIQSERSEPWLVWCELNDEADEITRRLPGAIQIAGSDGLDEKEQRLHAFCDGQSRLLVTKPSIAGFGLNLQHCARMLFVGVNNSFESWYQAVRRCWRFGQRRPVEVHVVYSDIEALIVRNLHRKEADAARMTRRMTEAIMAQQHWAQPVQPYTPHTAMTIPSWIATEETLPYAIRP
jgi:hypothetical protein